MAELVSSFGGLDPPFFADFGLAARVRAERLPSEALAALAALEVELSWVKLVRC